MDDGGPYKLPDGWGWSTLGEVCGRPQYGYTTKATSEASGPRFLRTSDLREDGVDWASVPFCAEPPRDEGKYALHDGDIVIARAGSVGKAHLVEAPPRAVFASYLIRFRPSGADTRYVANFLKSPLYWDQVRDYSAGITIPNVNASKLSTLAIPLPPLPEQQRIVDKIERLLEQSRTAREALDRIPPLLKRFRQSVLAKAFRGELTERDPIDEPASVLLERIREERRRTWEEDLRAKGKDPRTAKYVEPEPPDTSGFPELPEGWTWAVFEQILIELKNGFFSGSPAFDPPGIPILRISAVRPMELSYGSPRYVRKSGRGDPGKYRLAEGDLLFTRYNGSLDLVGVCALVRSPPPEVIYPDKLIRARLPTGSLSPRYLETYFATSFPRSIIEDKAKSSAGQQGISGRDLKAVPVALAPIREQLRIVAKVDALLAQADTVEKAVVRAARWEEQVDQAVLARAFRGNL